MSLTHLKSNSNVEELAAVMLKDLASGGKAMRQNCLAENDIPLRRRVAACIEIQRVYRGFNVRKRIIIPKSQLDKMDDYSPSQTYSSALKSIYLEKYSPVMKAAIVVQRWWRRLLDMNVYRYYRDLLNFHNRGDPSLMLRCINPTEAKLAEPAAGVHVKFRLAGERFPPHIYYKIFTHRPVQDIGAYAPRDYTKADCKRRMARDVHNRTERRRHIVTDQSGWYKRVEGNGWRIVSDEFIQQITRSTDPVTSETSSKKIEFHYSALQRKTDVEKRKRRRKIEWMQKIYLQGVRQEKPSGANAAVAATVDNEKIEEDYEFNKMIDWCSALDFDNYSNDWKEIGTTAMSEAPTVERIRLQISSHDPYSLTVGGVGT